MPAVETENPKSARPGHPAPDAGGNGAHPANAHAMDDHDLPKDLPKPSTFTVIIVVCVFVALLGAMFLIGYIPHRRGEAQAREDAAARGNGVPMVQVIAPKPSAAVKSLPFPCDVRANQSTDLFPRSNGYLKKWYVDIQDHVDENQLLADIDEPEVDAQLAQSKANLAQSEANVIKAQSDLDLADKTLKRYEETQKTSPGSVSQEQIDQNKSAVDDARSALAQANANVVASQANVQQLSVMQGFEKVYAPFCGTITARNYDNGALLNPANTGVGKQLFSIAQTDPLRVFVNVPQNESTQIAAGQPAKLEVTSYPGHDFDGAVARTSGSLDPTTRTLLVEIHFPNKDGKLLVGMYGQVRMDIGGDNPSLIIPSSALVFNADGLRVAVVKDNKIHLQQVKLGRDLGTELEVNTGLTPEDQVVVNPGERLAEGVQVQVPPPAEASAGNK